MPLPNGSRAFDGAKARGNATAPVALLERETSFRIIHRAFTVYLLTLMTIGLRVRRFVRLCFGSAWPGAFALGGIWQRRSKAAGRFHRAAFIFPTSNVFRFFHRHRAGLVKGFLAL